MIIIMVLGLLVTTRGRITCFILIDLLIIVMEDTHNYTYTGRSFLQVVTL